MIEIKRLTKKEEWKEAFPVMHELRTHIDEPTFLERIERCIKQESYTLFALYDHGAITAAGISSSRRIYVGGGPCHK